MKKVLSASVLALAVTLSGCATHELLSQGGTKTTTETKKQVLVDDHVLAFAKPAYPLPNMPSNSLVIVGQKHSYVLTSGADEFLALIGKLDAKNITLTKGLDFYSANDGKFSGSLSFKYRKLAEDVSKAERNYFLQHGVRECTSYDDKNLQAQSFCFDIPLQGVIYPAVSNPASLKHLSKPYPVTIYTEVETSKVEYESGKSVFRKLVLLPFAVAFDAATLPFQALNEIFD